jgi:glycine oxidase
MSKRTDHIIVGQGLAGTILAHTLLKNGKKIIVIDDPSLSDCSRISAGMYNPVVTRRLTKSWMADELLDHVHSFYTEAGKLLNIDLLFGRDIIKIFAEQAERNFWEKKRNEAVGKYLSPVSDEHIPELGETPFGHARVMHAGQVRVSEFLSRSRAHFKNARALLEEKFDHRQVELTNGGVSYKDVSAGTLIFCEGYTARENTWFDFIPFVPAKGELLTVRIEHLPLQQTIHKGVSLTPLGDDLFRVGSTFSWDELNDVPTEKAKNSLLEGVKQITDKEVVVVDHLAGVRPATNDRRPVIGKHPEHAQLVIFNGMGSKGVMLAPYFANELALNLENGTPLNKEVDIRRYYRK